ncbi:heat shock 70 kDa protein 12A-like isoform X1 [Dreissena polymorpha]|uniref:Uncharacterized protein n=1 Tax=Dreissena polymorpha TaxID=45954 RepID=A0A9D4QS67_DREPO|nr:heat shock 70 kDa protein 12A-like isoform X1 [Dreissena polymorpha]XP_052279263.1 heat shock 70 kDa protein 12A-like isoform X1 [Dreissena polymorpha]KAH3840692.1 hypothetical protein DPMN_114147 [Dreissena polymorpha]
MASKDFFLVAAIDFGTTFSGYAFSEVTEFQADPLRVSTCTWGSSTNSVMSLKTPSSILFRPEKTFDSFGFEAEDKYSNLSLDNMHRSWFYFRRFKMMLYNSKDVHRSNLLKDETGKEMPAIDVFAASIRYMKDHLGDFLSRRSTQIRDNEIRWVLTVPAIWDDAAKQFMREAAEKAGIDGQALLLALEPEAASMCCKYLPVERMETRIECFSPRSKYLVLDAGGGTVDITVHEVNPDGTLKELHKANGGPWGGTTVDQAFLDFLSEILGADVLQTFRDGHRDDYIDLLREFETRKRAVKPDSDSRVTFKMPISLHELYRKMKKAEIRDAVRDHPKYGGKITCAGDKMRVDADLIIALFSKTCYAIVKHIRDLLQNTSTRDTSTFLMVGGFSESPMLQDAIKKGFPDKKVVVPPDAGLTVLKGAVIFGHNSKMIVSRIAKYTYGFKCWQQFDPSIHPKERKEVRNNRYEVQGCFDKIVEVGQPVSPDSPIGPQQYSPQENEEWFSAKLFASPNKNPLFVDEEGTLRIGEVEVDCRDDKGNVSSADVYLIFGGTELEVKAVHSDTGRETKAKFDFLG